MADFFSRLAERALGVAPVVAPLIAPLTAPGPALAAAPFAGVEETLPEQPEEILLAPVPPGLPVATVAPPPPEKSAQPGRSTLSAPVVPDLQEQPPPRVEPVAPAALPSHEVAEHSLGPAEVGERNSGRNDRLLPEPSAPPLAAIQPQPTVSAALVTPRQPVDQSLERRAQPAQRKATDLTPTSVGPAAPSASKAAAPVTVSSLQPTNRPDAGRPQPLGWEATDSTPQGAHRSRPTVKPTVEPNVPPSPYPAPAMRPGVPMAISHPAPASPAPSPTVQVTIGRIEVRAILPPAPAPQPSARPATPRLSLADYLKQHAGEQR